MNIQQQIKGINKFLTMVYGAETRFSTLLTSLGFSTQQVELIRNQYLEQLVTNFLEALSRCLVAGRDGERLYKLVSRRFGLDGKPPDTLEALAQQFGISREQAQQLEYKAVSRCKSRASQQFLRTSLKSIALKWIGNAIPCPSADHAITRPDQVQQSTTQRRLPSKRQSKSLQHRGKGKSTTGWSGLDDSGDLPSGLTKHDPRPFTASLPRCPHGVLKIKPCAICDPEGFRQMTGED